MVEYVAAAYFLLEMLRSLLHIGKENQDCKTFLLGHHKLPLLRQVSDLGVIIDDKLRFSSHINHIE